MKLEQFDIFGGEVTSIPHEKVLINTINAHSFNVSKHDKQFQEALHNSGVLIPDGVSVVWAYRWLTGRRLKKIAGADVFFYEMERLQRMGGKCFFLGSSDFILEKIRSKVADDYPKVKVFTFSPPYKAKFSEEENKRMVGKVNAIQPDVLFIGMTAPKQEKWAYKHFTQLNVGNVCCIGAVFDFYAGNINRAPKWMIDIGLEWLFRLIMEPKRMWRRYLIGNTKFILSILKEKFFDE